MRFLALVLAVLFAGACNRKAYLFTSFREPANEGLRMLYSYDGYRWTDTDTILLKPEAGTQKIMRDPSMIRDSEGVFHLVWTTAWRGDKGFGYSSSKDLFNWTPQIFVPAMEKEKSAVNVWAPELFYDQTTQQYQVAWASTIPGRFEKGIEEDSNNHRMYFCTTKDFKTFSDPSILYDPGFSVIDAVTIRKAVNQYILVVKDNTRPNRNLRIARSSSAPGPYSEPGTPFTGKLSEGPTVVSIKGKWIIYYDDYGAKKYSAAETSDFISFKDVSSQISLPQGHKHGTIVTVDRKFVRAFLKKTAARL